MSRTGKKPTDYERVASATKSKFIRIPENECGGVSMIGYIDTYASYKSWPDRPKAATVAYNYGDLGYAGPASRSERNYLLIALFGRDLAPECGSVQDNVGDVLNSKAGILSWREKAAKAENTKLAEKSRGTHSAQTAFRARMSHVEKMISLLLPRMRASGACKKAYEIRRRVYGMYCDCRLLAKKLPSR